MRFTYCPDCGTHLASKKAGDDGAVPWCEKCGRYWFESFNSASIILVADEKDEIALLKQDYISDRYMNFVAGYIRPGETAEGAALREVREEIGLEVEDLDYKGSWWFSPKDLLMHGFIGRVKNKPLVLSEEVDQARWVKAKEAEPLLFPASPGNAQRALYEIFMKELKERKEDHGKDI